jgi:hypothetical protein
MIVMDQGFFYLVVMILFIGVLVILFVLERTIYNMEESLRMQLASAELVLQNHLCDIDRKLLVIEREIRNINRPPVYG